MKEIVKLCSYLVYFNNYVKEEFERMDKKMHQVSKRIATAEKDIKKGKSKEAVKVLAKAEKKNEKLVKIDKNIRDPLIEKCKKSMKSKKK